MAKGVSKSIRLSQELYDYIQGYHGEGFNDKFNNIIMDAKEAEPKLKERLAALEKRHKKVDRDLEDKLVKLKELENAVRTLVREYSWF